MAVVYYCYISIKGNSYFITEVKSHNEISENNDEKTLKMLFEYVFNKLILIFSFKQEFKK